jgi:hypothetical protein
MIDMANAKNVQEAESLLAIQGELIAEFDKRARDIGQFNSALNRVYQTSNFNYSLSRQIKKYKDMNNGVIPKEVEAKMKELEAPEFFIEMAIPLFNQVEIILDEIQEDPTLADRCRLQAEQFPWSKTIFRLENIDSLSAA